MYKETFNLRLKQARKESKLTQAEVSKAVGISQAMISLYEKGEREPNIETIGKLARLYCVTTDYLFGMAQF